MEYIVTFADAAACTAFANKCGLTPSGSETINTPISLLTTIKMDNSVVSVAVSGEGAEEFIIRTADISALTVELVVVQDFGDGTYIVATEDPLSLYDAVAGKMDPANAPVKLMSEIEGSPVTLADENANWARLRIAGRFRPLPTEFRKIAESDYKTKPEVFIVDSGINFDHVEFSDPNTEKVQFFTLEKYAESFADTTGHGTAMASAVAGVNTGLQHYVKLMSVKIFDGSEKPSLLEVGQALDAIRAHHDADPSTPRVVNCSWVATKSFYLDEKFQRLIDSGVTVVAAAGNFGDNVENYTPAGLPNVITVAASDIDDIAAGFNNFSAVQVDSNFGQLVDIFAPGVEVTVANYDGNYIRPTGTSASAAYVTGAASAIMAVAPSLQTPVSILQILINDSTQNILLLDTEKFVDANRMVHLIDGSVPLDTLNINLYLGYFNGDLTEITYNVYNYNFEGSIDPFGEPCSYELVWLDEDIRLKYEEFVALDASTAAVTITKPNIPLPEGKTLEVVKFKVKQTSTSGVEYSNPMFFFATDPDRDSTDYSYDSDLAAALETERSTSGVSNARTGITTAFKP